MRELDPKSPPPPSACAVVGAGRLGTVLAAALSEHAPLRRGEPLPPGTEVVLLCVPDGQIAAAAAAIPPGPLRRPLLRRDGARGARRPRGLLAAPADVRAHGQRAERAARRRARPWTATATARSRQRSALAEALGLRATRVEPEDRVAYHAAAAIAANFLVALEACAERLAATAGVSREQLAPLVLATAQQWAAMGPEAALTGPIVRGDEAVVARHRETVAERTPELLELWDALADATRALAGRTAWA